MSNTFDQDIVTPIPLRSADTVMRLDRLGCSHPTRLSFMRALLRRLRREDWQFERSTWQIDSRGIGHAVYSAKGPRHSYSLVAFAHDLPADKRSDRVIATAWDATFCLFDGIPSAQDIQRLAANVPKQEAGRVSERELSLSRANRSVRLWAQVVDRLAQGEQPSAELLDKTGYLMRTTAVYGSGKFGAADRYRVQERQLAGGPFRLEMLSVYLIRAFSLDLVEHMAKAKGGGSAVPLDPVLRRRLGVGNSTGLGMAPFLVNHPLLLHRWITARETALARVRSLDAATDEARHCLINLVDRACINAERWRSEHPLQLVKLSMLRLDLERVQAYLSDFDFGVKRPWNVLFEWAQQQLSLEGQEQVNALLLEPHGALVDGLSAEMFADEYAAFRIEGGGSLADLRQMLEKHYDWAIGVDYHKPENSARFWYVSADKLEPRLGQRYEEAGADFEQPLDIGRAAATLYRAINGEAPEEIVADFLLKHPEHRHMVRRAQLQARYGYSEIRDNLIAADMLPIDILRCKLSFFGATHFDPRSDRWVRIALFQNAPFPHELHTSADDDWSYPPLETSA